MKDIVYQRETRKKPKKFPSMKVSNIIIIAMTRGKGGGGGGVGWYSYITKGRDTCRKLQLKPLKETNLGVAQAFSFYP